MVHDETGLSLRITRLVAPVTALGPGHRVVLWVQGCDIGCVGCASVDTWDPSGGRVLATDEVAAAVAEQIRSGYLDGLTITGGEPTNQPEALSRLVREVRRLLDPELIDVLVFTGRTEAAAARRAPELIAQADCVVAGPFRRDLPAAGRLVASSNQVVNYRSPEARDRYASWLAADGARLEVAVDEGAVLLIGIPNRGDLDDFELRLRDRGVGLDGVSWRP
ncbi:4Fe-4S single cluster domain-containing protein [Kribbella sp. NPDC026611]|uniref:4Fe-4S single cluster domain-containing protein n=1 Tax=Kribbella sp. NPDC026611 TaxID=3154911 RepID=UPI0033FCDEE1